MSAIDTASVVVYRSTTDPNKGWWIATVPTSGQSFVVRRVLRDRDGSADMRQVEAEAARVVPEVEGWKPVGLTLRGSL